MQTRLLPAFMWITVAVLLATGLYMTTQAQERVIDQVETDRYEETFVERATRTRVGEWVKRINSEAVQDCRCELLADRTVPDTQ